jgi:hypothetical protein
MADKKHNRRDPDWLYENDALGHELDTVLAKYAASEPRQGLEERILANLRAEQTHVRDRIWWRWAIAGALAVVVVAGVALAWRWAAPSQPTIAKRPQPSTQQPQKTRTPIAVHDNTAIQPRARTGVRRTSVHPSRTTNVGVNTPKLEQFPSPQPMSEQEEILANYVGKYPEHAILIARARNEALQRDQLEEMKLSSVEDSTMDSDERNNHATDR